MTAPDPAMDMPARNWGQQGSFQQRIFPPSDGPAAGTLVQLPCINQDWLLPLMGCLEQLRNPSTWNVLTDFDLDGVLSWVTQLQEMVWGASLMGCCDVAMRLTSDCHLQFSTDGGFTYTTVSGWDTYLDSCVKAHIPPAVPPNPQGNPVDQQACNLAGFLASEVIQKAVQIAINDFNNNLKEAQFALDLMAGLSSVFPITFAVGQAAYDFYQWYTQVSIGQFTTAEADPVLWSDVTCAIYTAIKLDGYITASNLPTVISNICGIAYTPSVVIQAICSLVTSLGLGNLQAIQVFGAVEDVNCAHCVGGWCREWDFTAGTGGFSKGCAGGTLAGTHVNGVGWTSDVVGSPPYGLVCIIGTPFTSVTVTEVQMIVNSGYYTSPGFQFVRQLSLYNAGVLVRTITPFTHAPVSGGAAQNYPIPPTAIDNIGVIWASDSTTAGDVTIAGLRLSGTGTPGTMGSACP
jgi:hypothetical protein